MPRRGLLYFLRPLHRLARVLRRKPVVFLFWLTVGTLFIGATLFWLFERDATVHSFWDALFIAGASATTSETYNIVPQHGVGKALTVLMGFAGITLSGCFVAAVTALIIQGPEPDYEQHEFQSLAARLERIERCVVKLERRTRKLARGSRPPE